MTEEKTIESDSVMDSLEHAINVYNDDFPTWEEMMDQEDRQTLKNELAIIILQYNIAGSFKHFIDLIDSVSTDCNFIGEMIDILNYDLQYTQECLVDCDNEEYDHYTQREVDLKHMIEYFERYNIEEDSESVKAKVNALIMTLGTLFDLGLDNPADYVDYNVLAHKYNRMDKINPFPIFEINWEEGTVILHKTKEDSENNN